MSTPEGAVKRRVKKLLEEFGVHYFMPVQNGMGAPHLDFICCYNGRYFAIETKAGNKQPTVRQAGTIRNIQLAKGLAFVVNEETGMDTLRVWLEEVAGCS